MAEGDNPFWTFSLAVYARPHVAAACIDLQDRRGLDVNLLLFGCWAGHCGRELGPGDWETLRAAADPWQRNVVEPVRGARRWLKDQHTAPAAQAEALREAVKACELDAERLQQAVLHAALPLAAGEADAELAARNLLGYFDAAGLAPDAEDLAALARLVVGAHAGLPPLEALRLLQGA